MTTKTHEIYDVCYAVDVPLYLQRLRSRSELLLPRIALHHHHPDDDLPLGIGRQKDARRDRSEQKETGRKTEIRFYATSGEDAAGATTNGSRKREEEHTSLTSSSPCLESEMPSS